MTFPPDVVAAVCRHMDEDHPDDALLIVRALGGAPDATAARTTGVDGAGLRFSVDEPSGSREVDVPFARRISTRPEIREQVVGLYERACAVSGAPARPH
jgi:hypothetical protein